MKIFLLLLMIVTPFYVYAFSYYDFFTGNRKILNQIQQVKFGQGRNTFETNPIVTKTNGGEDLTPQQPTSQQDLNKSSFNELDAGCKQLTNKSRLNDAEEKKLFQKYNQKDNVGGNNNSRAVLSMTPENLKKYNLSKEEVAAEIAEKSLTDKTLVKINSESDKSELIKQLKTMGVFYDLVPDSIRSKLGNFGIFNNNGGIIGATSLNPQNPEKYDLFINMKKYENESGDLQRNILHTMSHEFGHILLDSEGKLSKGGTCGEKDTKDYTVTSGSTLPKALCYDQSKAYSRYASAFCSSGNNGGGRLSTKAELGTLSYTDSCSEDAAEAFSKFIMYCFLDDERKKQLKESPDIGNKVLFFNLFDDMKKYRQDILKQYSKSPLLE